MPSIAPLCRRLAVLGPIVLAALLQAGFATRPAVAQSPLATPLASPIAATSTLTTWTQLAADGSLVARAVVAGACPSIDIDGTATPMDVRAVPSDAFPDTVCEATLPADASKATIAGRSVPLLPNKVRRIAVIGDTGCRIAKDDVQACNDPSAWPLVQISQQIAAWQPDLIIHVGDYVYREAACPVGEEGCAGSPFGDNAATWEADTFRPMASVLPAAPWIFLRGNHEDCDREGLGWFRYLDTGKDATTCRDFTNPYALEVDGLRFIVMDTAAVGDTKTTPELNEEFARQLGAIEAMGGTGAWLLTHKPIAGAVLDLGKDEQAVSYATIREATGNKLPDNLDVVLSGHVHLAEAVLFSDSAQAPTQLVSGNGGTKLDKGETAVFDGRLLGNPEIDAGIVGAGFGWMTLEIDGDHLVGTALRTDGGSFFRLHLPAPR